jgi:hypothetical protein
MPLVAVPAPRSLVRVVTRKLFQHVTRLIHDKNLLTAIAAKGFCERDQTEMTALATGTGILLS